MEENNREAKHDPPDSRSPEGRVKGEGESRGYEFIPYLPLETYPVDSSPPFFLL
jgi:hypothetical protein